MTLEHSPDDLLRQHCKPVPVDVPITKELRSKLRKGLMENNGLVAGSLALALLNRMDDLEADRDELLEMVASEKSKLEEDCPLPYEYYKDNKCVTSCKECVVGWLEKKRKGIVVW